MIYAYLSDTALTPLLTNTTTHIDQAIANYNEYLGLSAGGVGQVSERVLSMFNVDYSINIPKQEDETAQKAQKYPNLIIDPRVAADSITSTDRQPYMTDRLLGLFTGEIGKVSGTSTERAVGRMCLHYDSYLAAKEANPSGTGGDKGNLLASLENNSTNNKEFAMLFNVIEACVFSHRYNYANNLWEYLNINDLNDTLAGNTTLYGCGSSTEAKAGYIYDSIVVPTINSDIETGCRRATVRNRNTMASSGVIKTGIGSDSTLDSYAAPILFPDFIQFSFRFTGLKEPTIIRIYLNPKTLLTEYNRNTITNVICPAKPADLVALSYDNIEIALRESSKYVADTMSGEVTKTDTDPTLTTNHSGALGFRTRYIVPQSSSATESEYIFTFTCVYKGRRPTAAEMRKAIRDVLEAARGGSVKDIFPDLYITTSFILVPMYETRITSDINLNVVYCSNIFSGAQFFMNYNGYKFTSAFADVPKPVINNSSVLNVPAYYMHVLAYPEDYNNSEERTEFYRFDQVSCFKSYQPIASTDKYWGTLSDEARELNRILSKLIASQLYGYAPTDVTYTVETKQIFGEDFKRTYLTFTVSEYSFSMMTRESYISNKAM